MNRISVIIPVYNGEKYLRECIDSVLGQTLRDIEVVCVNDGSTDGSLEILSKYASDDSRLKLVSQPNAGLGAARNKGLELATGEFVHFMDADDKFAGDDVLARLIAAAEKDELEALLFDADVFGDAGSAKSIHHGDYIRRHDYSGVCSGTELFGRMRKNKEYVVSACLVLLRREFMVRNSVRFPDLRIFHEDNVFLTHVLLSAKRASHRNWICYHRRAHAGSIVTTAPTVRHLRGYLFCYLDATGILARDGLDTAAKSMLRDRQVVYRLHVRRLVDSCPALLEKALPELSHDEYAALQEVLKYPLHEKIVNAFRCLRDRGFTYTIRRMLFGRQEG